MWFFPFKKKQERALKQTLGHPSVLSSIFGTSATLSSSPVTEHTALTIAAVNCAGRCLSETIASLPFILYQREGEAKTRAIDHPVYPLLRTRPNSELTAMMFWETVVLQILFWGNSFSEIERANDGTPLNLWLLPANRVEILRDQVGELLYRVTMDSGEPSVLKAADCLHIPGMAAVDGIVGQSVISYARESLGIALAQDKHAAKLFGQGTILGGVLTHPGKLGDEGVARLRRSFEEFHSGKPFRLAVLEEGMTFSSGTMPSTDAQFLESRQFSVLEVCRWFRVPSTLLYDPSASTFNNVEQFASQFLQFSLRPWLSRISQEVNRKLLKPDERDTFFAEHLTQDLLRADLASRYASYAIGIGNGWVCPDEVRAFENLSPLANGVGQEYLRPLNMTLRTNRLTNDQLTQVLSIMEKAKAGILDKEMAQQLINNIAPDLGLNVKETNGTAQPS